MTRHPQVMEIVLDVIDGRLTHREALAILRRRHMTADIEALQDAVHWQRQATGLAEGDIDPLTLADGQHWPSTGESCRAYFEARAIDARDEALDRLAMSALVSAL